jgi:hypothetical protein
LSITFTIDMIKHQNPNLVLTAASTQAAAIGVKSLSFERQETVVCRSGASFMAFRTISFANGLYDWPSTRLTNAIDAALFVYVSLVACAFLPARFTCSSAFSRFVRTINADPGLDLGLVVDRSPLSASLKSNHT